MAKNESLKEKEEEEELGWAEFEDVSSKRDEVDEKKRFDLIHDAFAELEMENT